MGPLTGATVKQQSIPVTIGIILISIVVSFTSHFGNPRGSRVPGKMTLEQQTYYGLSFVDWRDYQVSEDPFASIKKGQIWRFVTPMFLHGDEFHLAFNMLWVFFLGSAIERLHGSLFLVLLTLGTQVAGMMLQVLLPDANWMPEALHGSPFAIGASGAVYGLFGFLWIRPLLDPDYPIHLVPMNVALMLGWLVICMTPLIPNVANGAHLGGLFAGMLAAMAGHAMRR
jgi:GlpG protein